MSQNPRLRRMGPTPPSQRVYDGLHRDAHALTPMARIVLDAWLFDLLPRDQDCAGWTVAQMQALMERVNACWDEYGHLPSRLPDDLRVRHAELYEWAMREARERGWDPSLSDDD